MECCGPAWLVEPQGEEWPTGGVRAFDKGTPTELPIEVLGGLLDSKGFALGSR